MSALLTQLNKDASNFALLVIDAIDADGADTVYDPSSADAQYRCNLGRVVDACHRGKLPVFFCNDAHLRGLDNELSVWGEHGMAGETHIFPEIELGPNDRIIPKRRYSGFFGTDLDISLKELGVDSVIAIGGDTNICVLHTLADAFFNNYKSLVISDATLTFLGVGTQEGGLEHCKRCFGSEIVTTDELVAALN